MKKGIPTHYNGINFRSRLEAKWARMFDMLGWQWEYEPFDLDGYIPDFLIQAKTPILVEVKPASNVEQLEYMCQKAKEAVDFGGDYKFLGIGCTIPITNTSWNDSLPFGISMQSNPDEHYDDSTGTTHEAEFIVCDSCNRYSFYMPDLTWRCELCHKQSVKYENKVYKHWNREHTDKILSLWKQATNGTQYTRVFMAGSQKSVQAIPITTKIVEDDDVFFSPENCKAAEEWSNKRKLNLPDW